LAREFAVGMPELRKQSDGHGNGLFFGVEFFLTPPN
jgi:hypothetical protein